MWKKEEFSLPDYLIQFMNEKGLQPGEAIVIVRYGKTIELYYFDRDTKKEQKKPR